MVYVRLKSAVFLADPITPCLRCKREGGWFADFYHAVDRRNDLGDYIGRYAHETEYPVYQ